MKITRFLRESRIYENHEFFKNHEFLKTQSINKGTGRQVSQTVMANVNLKPN